MVVMLWSNGLDVHLLPLFVIACCAFWSCCNVCLRLELVQTTSFTGYWLVLLSRLLFFWTGPSLAQQMVVYFTDPPPLHYLKLLVDVAPNLQALWLCSLLDSHALQGQDLFRLLLRQNSRALTGLTCSYSQMSKWSVHNSAWPSVWLYQKWELSHRAHILLLYFWNPVLFAIELQFCPSSKRS